MSVPYNYAINDDVLFLLQGPHGREVPKQRSVYTVTARLPIEADGRSRYRIKSKTEKIERVVTEEQISQLAGMLATNSPARCAGFAPSADAGHAPPWDMERRSRRELVQTRTFMSRGIRFESGHREKLPAARLTPDKNHSNKKPCNKNPSNCRAPSRQSDCRKGK
jgi:hypothetical protein